jgi:hypothetical protein
MSRNWQKDEHKKLLKKIKTILQNSDDPVSTPNLFDKVEGEIHDWESDYLRYQLLPAALGRLEEKQEIEIGNKKHEGGNPTHYWRLKQ